MDSARKIMPMWLQIDSVASRIARDTKYEPEQKNRSPDWIDDRTSSYFWIGFAFRLASVILAATVDLQTHEKTSLGGTRPIGERGEQGPFKHYGQ